MDKISTIKQNILYFVESQGLKREDFFNKIEVSYSNFKGKSLFSEIGADKIVKIMTIYPQINTDWLLTGKGEMLRSNDAKALHSHSELVEKIEKIQKELDFKIEQVNFYKEKSTDLEKKLEDCEDEKKRIKTIS